MSINGKFVTSIFTTLTDKFLLVLAEIVFIKPRLYTAYCFHLQLSAEIQAIALEETKYCKV